MAEENDNGRKAMALWQQWQNWVVLALLSGIVWFAVHDLASFRDTINTTVSRQLLNSERLMHLEDNSTHLAEGQAELKAQQKEMNIKLDLIYAKVKK